MVYEETIPSTHNKMSNTTMVISMVAASQR
jgi:hypothetical protein